MNGSRKIFFNNTSLKAKRYKKELLHEFSAVIESGFFLEGQQNRKLCKKLQEFIDCKYVSSVASGHDALFLALQALQLSSDEEVIFPANAYPTAFPLMLSHAKPIPVDVDENGQLDPLQLKKHITDKTRVVVVVHLYGHIGNIKDIKEILQGKNIVLIEDCAQAFGAKYKGKYVGTLGDIGCFSFYPTKNLGTLGDGGAIVTHRKSYYDFFEAAKSYGEKKRYHSNFISGHSRLAELQAGVLRIYLRYIKKEIEKRKKLFEYYQLNLRSLKKYIRVIQSTKDVDPAPHLFVIYATKRNALQKYLANHKIPTMIHYPYPIHILPAFTSLEKQKGRFPVSERLSKHIISLPFHPHMTKQQVDYIIDRIIKFYLS